MQMNARDAALAALERCRRDGAWSVLSIDNVINKAELDRRDAALASRLCLGVLQNRSCCDYYIGLFYKKDVSKLEPKLLNILRLGTYQLLYLDKIPASAAVNEAVLMCKKHGLSRASGLANAVLRKLADAKDDLPDIPGKGTAGYLSVKYSHPLWLCEKICADKGYDFAEGFFRANNEAPELSLQVNRLKVKAEDYARALARNEVRFETVDGLEGCLLLGGGKVTELPGYDEGLFYVQDMAARAAVAIAGAKPGMKVLDCCSAPGGKSFSAAIDMCNSGSILSCDIHEKKLRLIRSGAERLGIDIISTEARDARKDEPGFREVFDLVIADVPCSGLGVIRKKPEIRNKSYEELQGLPAIQADILENVSGFVKPGGVLLYSTCTVLKEENEAVVLDFLRKHKEFAAEGFDVAKFRSDNGMYTFWPNTDGTDGFFAAKLRRMK